MSTHIEELTRQRDALLTSLDDTANRIQALPPDAPKEERDVLDTIFDRDNDAVKRLTDAIKKRQIVQAQRTELTPQNTDEPGARPVSVAKEPLIYERTGPNSFFRDIVQAREGSADALARLQRHQSEMRVEMRDLSSSATAGGEFVPPLYLQEEWIQLPRAGRVTANLMTARNLPPGTNVIHFPKLSTGAAVAIQASDNASVQETDPVTADYSVNVCTIAGQVDMSRQLFDLSQPGFDEIVMADLAKDYATKLDVQVISGSGGSGQARGIRNVSSINTTTYTDSTPTAAEFFPKVADAWQKVGSAIYSDANVIIMHPRRWAWLMASTDTTGRPLVSAEAPMNAIAGQNGPITQGLAGSLMGLPVYVDPNLPTNAGTNTNEDVVLVLNTNELYLMERGTPFTRVFEDVGSGTLTVRVSMWNYFAFAAGRLPGAITTIGGTGLTTPTF